MINIAIDPKLEGGRARCREPSAIFIIVLEGGALCMKDGRWHRLPTTRVSTIDPKLEGGRVRCREPSVLILVVEGGGSACSIDGAASDGKKVAFSAEMDASQFFEVARKARGEEEETTIS